MHIENMQHQLIERRGETYNVHVIHHIENNTEVNPTHYSTNENTKGWSKGSLHSDGRGML